MGKPERNEHRGAAVSAADLRRTVSPLMTGTLVRMTPGLGKALAALLEWADGIEERLEEIDRVAESGERAPLPRKFREQLYGLLSTGELLGQLEPSISDAARPGGPIEGDIIGGPGQVRFGESYGGTD